MCILLEGTVTAESTCFDRCHLTLLKIVDTKSRSCSVNDIQSRLMRCFTAVFPQLTPEEIAITRLDTLGCWDSVAAATLVTVIEEAFAIELSPEAIEASTSFRSLLNYLST